MGRKHQSGGRRGKLVSGGSLGTDFMKKLVMDLAPHLASIAAPIASEVGSFAASKLKGLTGSGARGGSARLSGQKGGAVFLSGQPPSLEQKKMLKLAKMRSMKLM